MGVYTICIPRKKDDVSSFGCGSEAKSSSLLLRRPQARFIAKDAGHMAYYLASFKSGEAKLWKVEKAAYALALQTGHHIG